MSNYTIVTVSETKNWFEDKGWPGEMHFLKNELDTKQVAIAHRKMPQNSGGKGGYGHKHKTQEEIIYVIAGEIEVKLDNEVKVIKTGQAIRIAPEVIRSIWNDKPAEAELLIISTRADDLQEETEMIANFWPVE